MEEALSTPTWSRNGILYRMVERGYDPEALFAFNKEHGTSPLNFIPDEPVRAHFGRLKSGETTVWGAFDDSHMPQYTVRKRVAYTTCTMVVALDGETCV